MFPTAMFLFFTGLVVTYSAIKSREKEVGIMAVALVIAGVGTLFINYLAVSSLS